MKKLGAYFDKQGELHIPASVPFPGGSNPGLKPREWLFLLLVSAENYSGDPKKFLEPLGSRATLWRVRKKLMEKGYF